jgi:glycosyltransferase involved in cell wall biosynthesis
VAEAMACGLPAMTSVYAGVADYIDDGIDGMVLRDPRDAQDLRGKIERLHEEPELRRKLGEAAARKAMEWNWDRHAATTWELLKGAAAKGTSQKL